MFAIKSVIILFWSFLALISLNHLYPFWGGLVFSTFLLGVIGWITIFITIGFLSRRFIKQVLFIFMVFFCIGYYLGPYLEPPADSLDHLKKTYYFCKRNAKQIEKENYGFWHYSMSSVFLCSVKESTSPENVLTRIDVIHGVYWGLLMVGLFILSKSAGMPDQWAFFSSLIAFLFFGTNRFSYFSYYTMAPSFSSILMYWIWMSVFFFKRSWKTILLGLVMVAISLPILWVNHIEEAVFIGFIAVMWLFCNIHERIWELLSTKKKTIDLLQSSNSQGLLHEHGIWYHQPRVQTWMKRNYLFILFFLLFILPQFEFFQNILTPWFPFNNWQKNQVLVYSWHGFHLMGKIWSYRINDTLGIISTIPVLLSIAFFWPKLIHINIEKKLRILILGILPFVGYIIPLFHFIWASNNKIEEYYRLCYCSMFWIPIAFFLYSLEGRFAIFWERLKSKNALNFLQLLKLGSSKTIYFTGCLILIILIGGIRSAPIYGKLDFILVETRPWWNEWRPMIENLMKQKGKPIYSDALTSNVLNAVFNQPVASKYQWGFRGSDLNVKTMDGIKTNKKNRCIINLHGFTPSWVPKETHHWSAKSANTSLYYQYNGISGEKLKEFLKENPPKNCEVYY